MLNCSTLNKKIKGACNLFPMHITLKLLDVLLKIFCGVGKRFYPKILLIKVLTID